MSMAGRRGMRVIGLLVAALLLGGMLAPPAQATDLLQFSLSVLIPFYDFSAGHASFLIVADGGGAGFISDNGNFVPMAFYDSTCAKKADQIISLTANDVSVLSVAALNPAAPAQGAILLGQPVAGTDAPFYADVLNVDLTNGTATLLNGIPTQFDSANWALFDQSAILTFGPLEASPISTTLTMLCPRSDLGTAMAAQTGGATGAFLPATGTQTYTLDIFVFNLDEKFLGSIHGVACSCFTRKALKDWIPQALTSDVSAYFQGNITPTVATSIRDSLATNELVPIAGFSETVINVGTTKFYWSSYLHHGSFSAR